MAQPNGAERTASGIEALIARLREEGVAAGRAEAEAIVAEANAAARAILDKAEAEAKAKRQAAMQEAEAFRRAGEDALASAMRDTVLDLKERLAGAFSGNVGEAVATAMRDEALLKEMILAVAGRARAEGGLDRAKEVTLVLPREAVGLDELRRRPEELREGSLAHFVAALAGEVLRPGVVVMRAEDGHGGLRIGLKDRGVMIDLSDRAVAAALLVHLAPRFRALMEGVVR